MRMILLIEALVVVRERDGWSDTSFVVLSSVEICFVGRPYVNLASRTIPYLLLVVYNLRLGVAVQ